MIMKMKKKMKKENLNCALPHDLIVDILVRLPVKSLLRFKSVCKPWLSLISHPQFAKSHFDLALSPPTHRLLLKRINHDTEIQSLDLDLQQELPSSSDVVVNLKTPAPYFLTLAPPNVHTFGSCRGLFLLSNTLDNLL